VWESPWEDGTTPLRWVDMQADEEEVIARIPSDTGGGPTPLRVDPHPAWDSTHRWVTFNAFPDGTRRIFVMHMDSLVGS
jgi:hypothetical protein